MPDLNPFPPQPPVTGPPPPFKPPRVEPKHPGGFIIIFHGTDAAMKLGGKVAKFADDKLFDDKVVDPALEAIENFVEERAARVPIKKVLGGAGLFVIEHTIISHSGKSADPQFVTVVRADGSKYRYADLSFQPRRLARGERLVDAPAGTVIFVSPKDGSTTVLPAGSPFALGVLNGSINPEKIRPVNQKAIDNEDRAEGIRRELLTERADP